MFCSRESKDPKEDSSSPGINSPETKHSNNYNNKDIKEIIIMEEDEDEEEKEDFQTCKNSIIMINKEEPSKIFSDIGSIQYSLKEIFPQSSQNEKFMKKMLDLINIIKILETQELMIRDIKESHFPEEILEINKKYESLGEFSIVVKSKEELNYYILQTSTKIIEDSVFSELNDLIKRMSKKFSPKYFMNYLNDMKIILSKLKTIIEFLPKCATFDKTDLLSYEPDHQYWKDLEPHIERKNFGDPHKLEKAFKKIVRYVLLANAIMAKENEHHHKITQTLAAGFGAIYYFLISSKANKKAQIFFADPHGPTAQKVWNIPDDSSLAKGILKIVLPSIEYNKKIFIERDLDEIISSESLGKEILENTINKIDENKKKPFKVTHLEVEEYYNELFKHNKERICVRILSSRKLPNKPKKLNQSPNIIEEFFTKVISNKKAQSYCFSESIIIHIHGGGFISMSSRSHQTYTRTWAKIMKIPIFSIDYRLAPQFTYPAAVDDCCQAYNWILKNVYDMFGKHI